MKRGGIILAGGRSSRMGEPKALLTWQGESFLDRLIGLFAECCDEVIVVTGFESIRLREQSRRIHQSRFVHNPQPERGMLSSLQAGLQSLSSDTSFVLFTPVDYPAVQQDTVRAIAAHHQASLVLPRYQGRRGHPVGCGRTLIDELLALPADSAANLVVRRHEQGAVYVDVDDPGIRQDVDHPADYAALKAGYTR